MCTDSIVVLDSRARPLNFTISVPAMTFNQGSRIVHHRTSFHLECAAEVLTTWFDDDGYGNEDRDYLTLNLKIESWEPDCTLLARIPASKDDMPAIAEGKKYVMTGQLYFKVPEKQWHRTYLIINEHKEVEASFDYGPPAYGIETPVASVSGNDTVNIRWIVQDEYEGAMYGQSLSFHDAEVKEWIVEQGLQKLWRFEGRWKGKEQFTVEGLQMAR